ncbi:MAG TPA: hydroxymethylglutaryl-CoA synthase [Candidatus Ligilactobacillus excrementigallinarum]|uniref:Hydroxymethylglutaryl-CoA synthase n=1 Tax=Candidatus Ligilactobacillus excrementigallinarum TaxID=2838641 RepID=A0A9D2A9E0_9LACO|nr:hydroxymethylglutaryl-CoA synthase [Candidatus Ligilactobacillus excrementigallinarum]
MNIGIDKIGFFTPHLYLDMKDLAQARNEDPNKYLIGIGQSKMAVIPPTQDVISMAANAADQILTAEDKEKIDMILFATESGVDNSKSGAVYLQRLLGFKNQVRVVEMKQACYAATAAIHFAHGHIAMNPDSKVLVIGADNARYGLKTKGEVTQGGGAAAMLISRNPRILSIQDDATFWAEDVMDFWRPLGHDEALVDGKYSTNVYLDFFKHVFDEYQAKTGFDISKFDALCFHLPYTKEGYKALKIAIEGADPTVAANLTREFENVRKYSNQIGNLYTGSLYLGFLSLLENANDLKAGMRIGLYSYGSGAQGEFYSGLLRPGFEKQIKHQAFQNVLDARQRLTVEEYEKVYNSRIKDEKTRMLDIESDPAKYVFAGVKDYQRQYLRK